MFELFFVFFAFHNLPVASLAHELGKFLEVVLVRLVKAVGYRAVDVDDSDNLEVEHRVSFTNFFTARRAKRPKETYLSICHNRHNNLTLRVTVARNVPREKIDVGHKLCLGSLSCCTADSTAEGNDLAGDFALERAEDQLRLLACCRP